MPLRLRTPQSRGVGVLLAALVLFFPWKVSPAKVVGPPDQDTITDVWLGLSEDELYLFRLDLRPGGEGEIGFVFVDDPPVIHPLSSWQYSKGKIEIRVNFGDSEKSWDHPLKGIVNYHAMELTMRGEGWSRRLNLRKEEPLEKSWRALREGMKAERPK